MWLATTGDVFWREWKCVIRSRVADPVHIIFEFIVLVQVVVHLLSESGWERDLFIQQVQIDFPEAIVWFVKIILFIFVVFVVGWDSLSLLDLSIFVDCTIANFDFAPLFNRVEKYYEEAWWTFMILLLLAKYFLTSLQQFLGRILHRGPHHWACIWDGIIMLAVRIVLSQHLQPRHQDIFNIAIKLIILQVYCFVEKNQCFEFLLCGEFLRSSLDDLLNLICNLLFYFKWNPVDLIGIQIIHNTIAPLLKLCFIESIFNCLPDLFSHYVLG